AGRPADPRLSTLPGRAARRPARRAGTSALMAALVYTLTALLGAAAAAIGVAGMLGASWAVDVDWLVPLGGLALEMDALAGLFVALAAATAVPASLSAIGYTGRERRRCLSHSFSV